MNAEAKIVTLDTSEIESVPPNTVDNVPVYFQKCCGFLNRKLFLLLVKVFGKSRAEMYFCYIKMRLAIKHIYRNEDVIISTFHKYYVALSAQKSSRKAIKALYIMDPFPAMFIEGQDVNNEGKGNLKMLSNYDVIFTTRFVKDAMIQRGYGTYVKRIVEVSFPMITGFSENEPKKNNEKITLLFSGRICYDIRSPGYYLKIISKLDSRFRVIFVGANCTSLRRLRIETDAELQILPPVEYAEVRKMMADADIMINIGNSIPVHIPSKTFEYINTGKPIVNFYKFDDCPTLYYTKRYPLCLNLSENDEDIDKATEQFINFCVANKGKQLDQNWILENYAESTPEVIAKTIDDTLNELLEEKRRKKR